MKVTVDRELCTGIGNCVAWAPTVFQFDDERKAVVVDVNSVDEATVLEAARSCPQDAIIVVDDAGNQIHP